MTPDGSSKVAHRSRDRGVGLVVAEVLDAAHRHADRAQRLDDRLRAVGVLVHAATASSVGSSPRTAARRDALGVVAAGDGDPAVVAGGGVDAVRVRTTASGWRSGPAPGRR